MKMKILAQIIFLMLMSTTLYAQDIKGSWNGTLNVQGVQLRIVLHVTKTDNQYNATMDSPNQNVGGIPVAATKFNYPNVRFEITSIGAVYEGTLSDSNITGKWMQSGQSFSLVLVEAENQSDKSE